MSAVTSFPFRFLIGLLASTLCGQQPAASSDALLQHAITLQQAGELDEAIRAYR